MEYFDDNPLEKKNEELREKDKRIQELQFLLRDERENNQKMCERFIKLQNELLSNLQMDSDRKNMRIKELETQLGNERQQSQKFYEATIKKEFKEIIKNST